VEFNEGLAGVSSQFYDPTKKDTPTNHQVAIIDWPAFPKLVKDAFPNNEEKAWRTAEENGAVSRRRYQDEYLEWHVLRNAAGKITRVSFTCETTQYFAFLARRAPQKLVEIYRGLVDPAVKDQVDLAGLTNATGSYEPLNRFNTDHGAAHLIQTNNNLYAEVQIAAQACILRRTAQGAPITDSDALIRCSQYGAPGRASDPKIGFTVNAQARLGQAITLCDPVALYITRWSSAGWLKPDGTQVGDYWRLVRGIGPVASGEPAMGLHLVYEVPAAEGFVVGDIRSAGAPIEWGGQIAERINVGLYAILWPGQFQNPSFRCGEFPQGAPGGGAAGPRSPTRVESESA
jgi:hypothetical protein